MKNLMDTIWEEGVNQADLMQAGAIDSSAATLLILAGSTHESVRAAVALNDSCSADILRILSADKSEYVRWCVHKTRSQHAIDYVIHPTAIVYEGAKLGKNVRIGPFSIVYSNVVIGDGVVIGAHCEIGHPVFGEIKLSPLEIGENSFIRSHSIFYEGSTFGENLITGHRVTVREKTFAGRDMQIGTLSDIQGTCHIGNFVKLHSNVHIGQHSRIEDYVWIFPYVVLTNDPHPPSNVMMGVIVEKYVAIATMSVILPGVTLKEGALIGAHSSVAKDVAPDTVVSGAPAKFICNTDQIKLKDGSGKSAYPWRRHFHRGYLPDAVKQWISEFKDA